MYEGLAEGPVGLLRLDAPLAQETRHVRGDEVSIGPSAGSEHALNERLGDLALVGVLGRVQTLAGLFASIQKDQYEGYAGWIHTDERPIMLDAVVHVEIGEVERVRPVAPVEHVCRVVGHEEAERGRKVVRLPHQRGELLELDVTTRMGQDTYQTAIV